MFYLSKSRYTAALQCPKKTPAQRRMENIGGNIMKLQ